MAVHVDQAEMRRVLDGLTDIQKQSGITLQWLMWDVARQAANNAIKYTAPWASGKSPGNSTKQLETGEKAIGYDLLGKKGASEDSRSGLFGFITDKMRIYPTFRGGGELPDFNMIKLKSGAVYLVDKNFTLEGAGRDELAKIHAANRGKNGRVSTAGRRDRKIGRWKAKNKYFAPRDSVLAYVRTAQTSVGKLKSGWLAAADHFQRLTGGPGMRKKWIRRHGVNGEKVNNVDKEGNGQCVITNNVPHANAIRPSLVPFVEKMATRYIEHPEYGLAKRIDDVIERFEKNKERMSETATVSQQRKFWKKLGEQEDGE